jgi:hypothetical protein
VQNIEFKKKKFIFLFQDACKNIFCDMIALKKNILLVWPNKKENFF